jgi:hypothetical protein
MAVDVGAHGWIWAHGGEVPEHVDAVLVCGGAAVLGGEAVVDGHDEARSSW